jgi:hypothetical protein
MFLHLEVEILFFKREEAASVDMKLFPALGFLTTHSGRRGGS